MLVFVTGVNGQLGYDTVKELLSRGHRVIGSGTAAVVSPVGRLAWNDREITISGGNIGMLTQDFYDTLTGIQYGEREDPFGWVVKLS